MSTVKCIQWWWCIECLYTGNIPICLSSCIQNCINTYHPFSVSVYMCFFYFLPFWWPLHFVLCLHGNLCKVARVPQKEGLNAMSLIDLFIGLEYVLLWCSKPKVSCVHMLHTWKFTYNEHSITLIQIIFGCSISQSPSLSLRQSVSILPCLSVWRNR